MSVIICDNDIPPLFILDDLENAFKWVCTLRKKYSSNSDVWRLRHDWGHIKNNMLVQLNDGSYQFGLLDRYEFDDAIISLWTSQDMIAFKQDFTNTLNHLLSLGAQKPDILAAMRRYIGQWARWTKIGLSTITDIELCGNLYLPGIYSCWMTCTKRQRLIIVC